MRKRPKHWYQNPRKRLIYPILFPIWLLTLLVWSPFEILGRIADFIEETIGSPMTHLVTWTDNYDYDQYSKTHPAHDVVRIVPPIIPIFHDTEDFQD